MPRETAIPKDVVSAVKAGATSVRVAELLGVDLTREGTTDRMRGRCPLPEHGKQRGLKPGPFVAFDGGGWHCFGCNEGNGDGISLYRAARGTGFRETIRALEELLGIAVDRPGNGHGARPRATKLRPAPAPAATKRETKRKEPAAPLPWEASEEPPAVLRHLQHGAPSDAWKIRDAAGCLFAVHCRFELDGGGKAFAWWRNGKWTLAGVKVAAAPLYGAELLGGWDQGAAVIVTEGEKAADALRARGLHAVATVTGAGSTPGAVVLAVLSGRLGPVILWPDADKDGTGRRHMEKVRQALPSGLDVRTFAPSDLPDKGDAVEWLAARASEVTADGLLGEILVGAVRHGPAKDEERPEPARVWAYPDITVSFGELARKTIPAREDVMAGVLKAGEACCVSGQPGRGKSFFTLAAAIAIASGRSFVGFTVPRARPVIYWDAELPEVEVRERMLSLAVGLGLSRKEFDALPLRLIVENAHDEAYPHLGTREGLVRVSDYLGQRPETEVMVFDSLRLLFRLGDENKSETWAPLSEFFLSMKRHGLSTLSVHHNSRNDTFNGHLSGTTTFSQVLNLSARTEGEDDPGATAFDVSYEKARSLRSAEKVPFGLRMEGEPDGRLYFVRCEASSKKKHKGGRPGDPRKPQAVALLAQGVSIRKVAAKTGAAPSAVQKWAKGLKEGAPVAGVPRTT
jgi:KaiC/GvpD/RAD55 family RecA-like ATPase